MSLIKSCGRIAGNLFNIGAGFAVGVIEQKDSLEYNFWVKSKEDLYRMATGRSPVARVTVLDKSCSLPVPSDNIYTDPREPAVLHAKGRLDG